MAKNKELEIHADGFKTIWRWNEDKTGVDVDVYSGDECILEWEYPRVPSFSSLKALACLWLPQILLEAHHNMRNKKANDAPNAQP